MGSCPSLRLLLGLDDLGDQDHDEKEDGGDYEDAPEFYVQLLADLGAAVEVGLGEEVVEPDCRKTVGDVKRRDEHPVKQVEGTIAVLHDKCPLGSGQNEEKDGYDYDQKVRHDKYSLFGGLHAFE